MSRLVNFLLSHLFLSFAAINLLLIPSFKSKYNQILQTLNNVPIDYSVPVVLKNAIILAEDKRFFSHFGIDCFGILRAVICNLTTSRFQGASTLVQQLVRCTTAQRQLTFKRKYTEALYAVLLSNRFSKTELIELYIKLYDFGNCKGLQELSVRLEINFASVNCNEAAQLAARLKYPNLTRGNYIRYLKRVRIIEKNLSLCFPV